MRTLTLNIIPGYVPTPIFKISRYDKGYTVTASVKNGVEDFTPPEGATATVEGRKPDDTGYQYPATIDGNTVTFTIMEQMTVLPGRSMAEVVYYDGDGVRIGTANFTLWVEPAPLDEDTPISETDIPLIEQAAENAARAERGARIAEAAAESAALSAANASDSATTATEAAAAAAASATASAESADEAEEWAEKAEQAAAQSGYMWFYIEAGKLYMDRTENTEVTFYLENGKLYVEEVTS